MESFKTKCVGAMAKISFHSMPGLSNIEEKQYYVRHMKIDDLDAVQHLIHENVNNFFGQIHLRELWEMCFLSLVYCSASSSEKEEICAAICVTNYPPVKSIAPWTWDSWLYKLYRLETVNIQNSIWVHLMAWNDDCTWIFFFTIMEALYEYCPWLHYVLFVKPPGPASYVNVNILEKYCTPVLPKDYPENKMMQTIYLCARWHFLKTYKIRRAVEEDNDDIVPLIDMHSHLPRDMYGEYYIAELVYKFPDCGRQLIVAEYQGLAAAVLCFNRIVDYKLLNDNFELRPFYGLKKPDSMDRLSERHIFMSTNTLTELDTSRSAITFESYTELMASSIRNSVPSTFSGVSNTNFMEEAAEEEDLIIIANSNFEMSTSSSESILTYLSEEESSESLQSVRYDEERFSTLLLCYNEYEMMTLLRRDMFIGKSYEELEQIPKQLIKPWKLNIPEYMGKENGFSLEIAAAEPEHEDAALNELLIAGFECFPDRDYCVLAIPSTARSFQFLEEFIHVVPRPISSFPQELYVLHRNAVNAPLTFREAELKDMDQIRALTTEIAFPILILSHLHGILVGEDQESRAFVLLSTSTIIGVAILREERDADYIREHYDLLPWLQESLHSIASYGLIEHLLISPIFQRYGRFFLRELHRLTDFSVLYYRVFPSDTSTFRRHRCLIGVLGELPSPKPRRTPEYNTTDLDDRMPVMAATRIDPPYALFLSTVRLCGMKPKIINHHIVVVGASDCALSFLETLVCNTNPNDQLYFTNVTLVSPHGLGYVKPPIQNKNPLFVKRGKWCYRYLQLIALRTYVNVVNGIMTAIDRQNKMLTINDDSVLSYDVLILTCGEQYLKPGPEIITTPKKMKPATEFPTNIFLINTDVDGATALGKTKKIISSARKRKTAYQIIVYGCTLDAYSCIAELLECGIPGGNIAFVEPFPDEHSTFAVSCFNDAEVDEAIQEAIKNRGIIVYSSFYFSEYNLDNTGSKSDLKGREPTAKSVKFVSTHRYLELECSAMFYYGKKGVSIRTYLAISKAGLVYDGRLVIDPKFRTNDPSIYAAGSLTKYKRKYYADHLCHKHFNMDEIGRELGKQIRETLKPKSANPKPNKPKIEIDDCEEEMEEDKVPQYAEPLVYNCILPGKWNFLYVTKPGVQIPIEAASTTDDYGEVLLTGSVRSKTQGYFRIHLNSFKTVQTITCLNKEPLDVNNIISLWGKHERLLNNLELRFDMVMITDLFEYFRQPWTCAVFHDRFPRLEANATQIVTAPSELPGESPLEEFYELFMSNKWKKLKDEQRKVVELKFEESPYQEQLEELLLNFIQDNISQLPMYAHPLVVKAILQGYENSPLFNEY